MHLPQHPITAAQALLQFHASQGIGRTDTLLSHAKRRAQRATSFSKCGDRRSWASKQSCCLQSSSMLQLSGRFTFPRQQTTSQARLPPKALEGLVVSTGQPLQLTGITSSVMASSCWLSCKTLQISSVACRRVYSVADCGLDPMRKCGGGRLSTEPVACCSLC